MDEMYEYQREMLPDWIQGSSEFFDDILQHGEKRVLYQTCLRQYQRYGKKLPYAEKDFGGFHMRVDINTPMVILELPKPQEYDLCYRIYMFVDEKDARIGCYLVTREKASDGIDEMVMYYHDEERKDHLLGSHRLYTMAVASIFEMRTFYAHFHQLGDVKIPPLLEADPQSFQSIECPKCSVLMTYDLRGINQDDQLLVQCPRCMRIYHARKDSDGFTLLNEFDR